MYICYVIIIFVIIYALSFFSIIILNSTSYGTVFTNSKIINKFVVSKISNPCFYDIFICTKFCSGLIRFHVVIKLLSFESGISHVIPGNVQNIPPLVFVAFFRSHLLQTFMMFLTIFHKIVRGYYVVHD